MITEKINRFHSKAINSRYAVIETIRPFFARKEKLKILFSVKPAWEEDIRSGFKFSGHELEFNELTPENIKRADLVVPLTISDLELLNWDRSLIENNAIPIPQLEIIRLCSDKYRFYQVLKAIGFERALPKVSDDLGYPYILKAKSGEYGADCYVIRDAETEKKHEEFANSPNFFRQEIIESINEYATHILFKEDKIRASITMEYTWRSKTAINGKDKFISRRMVKCPHLELFSEILQSIGFEGLCCFDYKVVKGQPYIFEINPRFGGSLTSFFFSFIRHLDKNPASAAPNYTLNHQSGFPAEGHGHYSPELQKADVQNFL